ncbi:E3 ubiquitin-protein ligase RNF166 isoform X1 [Falco rusticolus]|uniref:E3 ubiquitin-protein ligase RNF166 isoform X1 n=1 Tax=Falco rusticolus TaxID=120794 RepID=UPI0018865C19|nr:E3 ubiquitin-protein ligase RNF166 isoform X1 [Falco rusticolus]
MFRSLLVAAAQRPQAPGGSPRPPPASGPAAEALEAQFSCPICLEVFHRAVGIAGCGHTFCGECLQPCLQVPSPLCPLCRMPFDPKKVEKASSVEKQLSSYKAPCRGCSKKVTLAKMRSHVSSCAKVQEQMASCPKFVPVVPTSQPIPSNIPNRSTFVCPYCGARNLDQQELVKHCMENHRNDPNKVRLSGMSCLSPPVSATWVVLDFLSPSMLGCLRWGTCSSSTVSEVLRCVPRLLSHALGGSQLQECQLPPAPPPQAQILLRHLRGLQHR